MLKGEIKKIKTQSHLNQPIKLMTRIMRLE